MVAGQIWATHYTGAGGPGVKLQCFDGTTTYTYTLVTANSSSGAAVDGEFSYTELLTGIGGSIIFVGPLVSWGGTWYQVNFTVPAGNYNTVIKRSSTLAEAVVFTGIGLCLCNGNTTWTYLTNGAIG